MKWFYNLKIGSKLLASFVLVALIACAIGILGIIKIQQIEQSSSEMYERNTKPMAPILDMSVAFQRIRVNYRDIALADSAELRSKYAARIKELEKVIADCYPEIEKSLKSAETKKAFAEIKDSHEKFKPVVEKIITLAMAGKSTEAAAYMRSDVAFGAAKAVDTALQKLADIKIDLAKKKDVENNAAAKTAMTVTTVFAVIGVLLAIGLGVLISRMIARPLREAVDISNKLAEGDLTVSIDVTSKDETGLLLEAMQHMVERLKEVVADVKAASDNVASG